MRVRTALVTARSAPAHERAIRTLMDWNIEVDEAMFLGGLPKGEFLREFEPDFFFDDQTGHVESAAPSMCLPGTWPAFITRIGLHREPANTPDRPASKIQFLRNLCEKGVGTVPRPISEVRREMEGPRAARWPSCC
jgi:hypothetical protein